MVDQVLETYRRGGLKNSQDWVPQLWISGKSRRARLKALRDWVILILSIIGTWSPLLAQPHYAIDAYQGCWGEVPADPGLSPGLLWTGEAWVYLQDDASPQQVIFRTDSEPGSFSLSVLEGKPAAAISLMGPTALEAMGQIPLPLGAWAHLAACYDAAGLHLFLNGQEDAFTAGTGLPASAPGPIFIGGGDPDEQLFGLADEIRLSDTVRYSNSFNPFNIPLENLRIGDQAVPGWALGTGPGDLQVAWDSTSLYDIIDGAAVTYLIHNFQYAVQQYYYGLVGDTLVALRLWMTDQGTPENAQALFHDPMITPFFYLPIDSIGQEARLDTGLLFDYLLDFWQDKYYVSITVNKEGDEEEALEVVLNFGAEADTNILNRFLFVPDEQTTALWHFDEGSGAIFSDASGQGHNGTLNNPAWAAVAPYQPILYITSARLLEGDLQIGQIDEDDTARVTFSHPVEPITIHAGNIDQILQLPAGHSWLSGGGQLGSATWNASRDTLKISFSPAGGAPTIADGDTVTPNPARLASDQGLPAGGYRFIRFDDISGLRSPPAFLSPNTVKLYPPNPTPFNAVVLLEFDLPHPAAVVLKVLDPAGREISILFQGYKEAGRHAMTWNAADLASGIYFVSLRADGKHLVRKAVLIK